MSCQAPTPASLIGVKRTRVLETRAFKDGIHFYLPRLALRLTNVDGWVKLNDTSRHLVPWRINDTSTASAITKPANNKLQIVRSHFHVTNSLLVWEKTGVIARRRKRSEAQWRTPHTVPVAKHSMQQQLLKSSLMLLLASW